MKIPAFIICRDRPSNLDRLTKWLEPQCEVIIVDNNSTYPGMVEWLDKTKYKTYRLKSNHSKWAPWKEGLIEKHPSDYFIVCDPDMYPSEDMPDDAVEHWIEGLDKYPQLNCTGPSYIIWDLPEHYAARQQVVKWEGQFWAHPIDGTVESAEYFEAPIDSMFGVFRKGGEINIEVNSGRSNHPYTMHHQTWYMDTDNPLEEEQWYIDRCDPNRAHWVREVWND